MVDHPTCQLWLLGRRNMSQTERPLRADAQRNYVLIVEAAASELARVGAEASLEEIARKAGVGSATLHRRFPTRRKLFQAVFADQIDAFCREAVDENRNQSPSAAMKDWLLQLATYSARTRGVADAIRFDDGEPDDGTCEAALLTAATVLLERAKAEGTIRGSVTALDLLTLVNGISIAAKDHPDPSRTARSLTTLALEGIAR